MPSSKDIFRDSKLKLYGPPVSPGDKIPNMQLQFYRTNVGIAVNTATERDPVAGGWINAKLSYFTLGMVFEVIRGYAGYGILAGQLPQVVVVENYQPVKNPDGSSAGKAIASLLEIGLDEKDEVYISAIDADQSRPMIRMRFYDTYWHVFKDRDTGQPLTPQRMSRLGALSAVNTWEKLIPTAVLDEFKEGAASAGAAAGEGGEANGGYQRPQNNQGGGGWKSGNNNWKGNNGGGKPWQKGNWNGGGGGQGKPWQNNNNGGGGYKQSGGYNNGGGNGGYQNNNQNNYQNNQQQQNQGGGGYQSNQNNQGGSGSPGLDDKVPF